jgi:hypothetical protein
VILLVNKLLLLAHVTTIHSGYLTKLHTQTNYRDNLQTYTFYKKLRIRVRTGVSYCFALILELKFLTCFLTFIWAIGRQKYNFA